MATTTNYGWTTPDDTALVKDGASAIRTLGSSVDTTTKNLNPETTLGDIAYRSSTSNVNTRLGIGTTGQILTVAGGVPSWATAATPASGLTLISTTTIGTAVSSVTVSGAFSATYDNYKIIVTATSHSTASNLAMTLGATATGYYTCGFYQAFGTATVNGLENTNVSSAIGIYGGTNGSAGIIEIQKPQLAQRTVYSIISSDPTTTGYNAFFKGFLNNATQYTAFTLTPDSGTITGGQVRVYGYQNS